MLHETFEIPSQPVTLIHHAANCGHNAPPGSLSALEVCLAKGVAAVEIDIIPLADGNFAMLHGRDLSEDTNGEGDASQATRAQVKDLCYKMDGEVTAEKVGFLEGALELLKTYPETQRLQLDFKPAAPLTRAVLRDFLELIDPVRERVQVTSIADWAVRALHKFDPNLSLGFDPLLYLDLVEKEPRPENVPPFRVGSYGFADDHPLAAVKWGPLGDYFAARAGALLVQAPKGCEWFIRAELLQAALNAGFNWIDFLHQHGSRVDAWTIDAANPNQVKLAQFLVEKGVDELTTDTPTQLANSLTAETIL